MLPNIISYKSRQESSANEVRIRYSVPSVYQGPGTAQPLWESETYVLGAGALSTDLGLEDEYFNLETTIPPNTTASLIIPANTKEALLLNGKKVTDSPNNMKLIKTGINSFELLVQPGTYSFQSKLNN